METAVYLIDSNQVNDYTEYIIEVHHAGYMWKVKHRYSEFKSMHDAIRLKHPQVDKGLLPPKKLFRKLSPAFIDKRKGELEVYLQSLFNVKFERGLPLPLKNFLQFNLYDVEMICQNLAEKLYRIGDGILNSGSSYTFNTLELWAVTERISLEKPSSDIENASYDFGHLLDFVYNLKYLHIVCQRGSIGTSNIMAEELMFDISVFRSLNQLVADGCSGEQAKSFAKLHAILTSLSVHKSLTTLQSILTGGCDIIDSSIEWRNLVTADFSDNNIAVIDSSVKLMTCIEFLDLSRNKISKIENLHYLTSLTFIDLSHNKISEFHCAHARLGNVKTLILASNKLTSLYGLEKLYSLENLNVSSNWIAELDEVDHVSRLPCILQLNLSKNAVVSELDYRTKILSKFGNRACEVCLDETPSTQKELDTAAVLHAIFKSHRMSTSGSSTSGSYQTGTSSPIQIQRRQAPESAVFSAPGRFCATPETLKSQIASLEIDSLQEDKAGSMPKALDNKVESRATSRDEVDLLKSDLKSSSLPPVDTVLQSQNNETSATSHDGQSETLFKSRDAEAKASESASKSQKSATESCGSPEDFEDGSNASLIINDHKLNSSHVEKPPVDNDVTEVPFNEMSSTSHGETMDSSHERDVPAESSEDDGLEIQESSSVSYNDTLSVTCDKKGDSFNDSLSVAVNESNSTEHMTAKSSLHAVITDDNGTHVVDAAKPDDLHYNGFSEKTCDEKDNGASGSTQSVLATIIGDAKADSFHGDNSAAETSDDSSIYHIAGQHHPSGIASNGNFVCGKQANTLHEDEEVKAAHEDHDELQKQEFNENIQEVDANVISGGDNGLISGVSAADNLNDIAVFEKQDDEPHVSTGKLVTSSEQVNEFSGEGGQEDNFIDIYKTSLDHSSDHEGKTVSALTENQADKVSVAPVEHANEEIHHVTCKTKITEVEKPAQFCETTEVEQKLDLLNFTKESDLMKDLQGYDSKTEADFFKTQEEVENHLKIGEIHNRLSRSCENMTSSSRKEAVFEESCVVRSYSMSTNTDPTYSISNEQKRNQLSRSLNQRQHILPHGEAIDLRRNGRRVDKRDVSSLIPFVEPILNLQLSSISLRHLSMLPPLQLKNHKFDCFHTTEHLRYITWSHVVFYDQPDVEISCAILLTNEAVYFARDLLPLLSSASLDIETLTNLKKLDEKSFIRFPLVDEPSSSKLVQLVVGLNAQYIRITGSNPTCVATVVTRSRVLTENFATHLLSALEEPNETVENLQRLLQISDQLVDQEVWLRSKVHVTLANEQGMMEFNLTTLELPDYKSKVDKASQFVAYFLVHLNNERKQAKAFILTTEFCCLCDENVVSYPIPDFESVPPSQHRYDNLLLLSLKDILCVEVDDFVGYRITIKSKAFDWQLTFRDYNESSKLVQALCSHFELVNGTTLQIHCAK